MKPFIRPAINVGLGVCSSAVATVAIEKLIPEQKTWYGKVVKKVGVFVIATYISDKATAHIMTELVDPILKASQVLNEMEEQHE